MLHTRTFRTLFVLTAVAGFMPAQMSGLYTISPTGSGTRLFNTFAAAATALSTNGVNGPCVFSVSLGTYVESWALNAIPGTSSTNTVTFSSSIPANLKLVRLQAASGDLITLSGVNNIIFEGLTFENVANSSAINALYVSSPRATCDDIEIRNCNFENTVVPNTSYGAIRTQSTLRWNIHHNEFDVNGTALYTQGATEMRVASNKFNNNGYPYCLSLWNSNRSRCLVFNNLFTGKVTSEGIRAWPSHYQIDFWHNTFALETDGWVVNNRQCCTVAWNTYYNNIFAVTGNGGAIYNNGGGQLECDNNLYFVASGKIGRNGTTDYTTLASWSAAIQGVANNGAYDSNSISANPLFMGATDFHLTPASPALGAAKATPGSFSVGFEVVDDYDGFMRGTTKDIGCFEVTGWKRFGAGCPGTANLVPAFNIGGNVAPGSTASLELSNARASASCVLTLGVSATSIPVGGTCQLLTSPLILVFFQSDAQGNAALPTPIPANVAILGLSGYLQFGVTDPMGAALGIMALSDGAQVRL